MIRRAWAWIWEGRMCQRCKLERTYFHFVDKLCTTCWVVAVYKGNEPWTRP